jgi:hypothetical protein
MLYTELTKMAAQILSRAGLFSDPLKVDLENMLIDCDSENMFLNATLDCLEIILQDPGQYLEFSESKNNEVQKFANEISKLHTLVLDTISTPIDLRNS